MFSIQGHSVPIASLGAFILFLGFLAFNGGSELAIVGSEGHGHAVAKSFMNTIIGRVLYSSILNSHAVGRDNSQPKKSDDYSYSQRA